MLAHVIFSGKVQGVGFRYSAQQKARNYHLHGVVRNLENGDVELEVEGPKDQLEEYINELRSGLNQFIRVDHAKINYTEKEKGYRGFHTE
jgi:acylphosphatase